MTRRTLWNVALYALALGLLAGVVWMNWEPGDGKKGLRHIWLHHEINITFLAAGFVLLVGSALLTLVRWYFLVRAQGLPFTLPDAMRLGLIGLFFNSFLPGSVGGDVIKAAALAREQSRRAVAVATVIMDRVIALWGLLWFVAIIGGACILLGQLTSPKGIAVWQVCAVIVAVSVVVWVAMGYLSDHGAHRIAGRFRTLPKVGNTLAEFWLAASMYRRRQKSVALALGLTWIGQVGFAVGFFCCTMALTPAVGEIPSLADHFVIVPLALIIRAVPLLPGGVGLSELGFGGLYELFVDGSSSFGVLGSLVQRACEWSYGFLGFLLYLKLRAASRPAPKPSPTVPRTGVSVPAEAPAAG